MAASQASDEQIQLAQLSKTYLQEAGGCLHADPPLWRLGVVALGSALETLLRIKYGPGPKDLFALIDEFDKDTYWNGMQLHFEADKRCSTCSLDAIRKQRNSVHPHRWIECDRQEFERAMVSVLLMQHILIYCDETKIAAFSAGVAFEDVFTRPTPDEARQLGLTVLEDESH